MNKYIKMNKYFLKTGKKRGSEGSVFRRRLVNFLLGTARVSLV